MDMFSNQFYNLNWHIAALQMTEVDVCFVYTNTY